MSITKAILSLITSVSTEARVNELQTESDAAASAEAAARDRYQAVVQQARDGEADFSDVLKAKARLTEASQKAAAASDIVAAAAAKHEQVKAAEEREHLVGRWRQYLQISERRVKEAEAFAKAAADLAAKRDALAATTEEMAQAGLIPATPNEDQAAVRGERFNRAVFEELCRQHITATITNPAGYNLKPIVDVFTEAAAWIRGRRDAALGAQA
ncbi:MULTISPECIES: hypothetical protein [Dyella]|uniref:Uncharacterized protein n=2 Tax=Dyella TaxID=231454 RepID=A0A4R0Z0I5_9GAMM|nr:MULTISPECIES: hypothetical protein [Dyella]TBR39268.1 hypothetical protein EYV96_03315 [Dyella terrae]TCI13144.1 hypothetical protein EZM97_07550 [Dyella soli]